MIFGIISYHRAETQKTLDYLTQNRVPKDKIILSLNDPKDIERYRELYSDRAKIICKEKGNAAGNRNNILEYIGKGKRLVLLDDDVKWAEKWEEKGRQGKMRKISFEEFTEALESGFNLAEAYGSRVFGFYPMSNPLFIKQTRESDGDYSFDKLFQGGCMGIVTSDDRFDERVPVCDDYEFILRQISNGRGAIRINSYAVVKDKDFTTTGGCYEAYKNGAQKKALTMIAKKYPHLVSVKKDFSGLRIKRGGKSK